jgi:Protein of unknown function (DUF2589)
MPTPGDTLAALDFYALIKEPMVAAIQAEADAALVTVNFVNMLGAATTTFTYDKVVQDSTSGFPTTKSVTLTVPTLALVRPPVLRVETVDIEFLAKINTVEYREASTQVDVNGSLEFGARWRWGHVGLRVSAAYQQKTREGNTRTEEYSMSVKVHAAQGQISEGLARVFALLESSLHEKETG